MSNIFYSNVDRNLQTELNARGLAGKTDRSTDALNFMLGKIANVRLTAFEGNSNKTPIVKEYGVIGGETVREGSYLPNGPDGFLSDKTYTTSSIVFDSTGKAQKVYSPPINDTSRRTGPFISNVDIQIGDHSMGLLNKGTIQISVPNPTRDLEGVESTWMRPGRFIRVEIQYPRSAVITASDKYKNTKESTDGKLQPTTLPKPEVIKERYPDWDVNELLNQIQFMNKFQFEGLITSFNLSYTESGQVDITFSVTGTSNVLTDITMLTPTTAKKPAKPTIEQNAELNPTYTTVNSEKTDTGETPNTQLYQTIIEEITRFENRHIPVSQQNITTGFIRTAPSTDQFILLGQPYNPTVNDDGITQIVADLNAVTGPESASSKAFATRLTKNNEQEASKNVYHRYITLGYLVELVNRFVVTNIQGSTPFAKIICDDVLCYSNYLPLLTSCTPNDILFMPKIGTEIENDINCYGPVRFYQSATNIYGQWPGVYAKEGSTDTVIYPSRILINVEVIQTITNSLSANNTRNFKLKDFFAGISSKIQYATGNAIELKLMSYPSDVTKLLFTDVKHIKRTTSDTNQPVFAYSVPMMANHPYGTIVRSFSFDGSLPDNVKNLSYVLNQGNDVTESEIAPYMNFMYNSKNEEAINKIIQQYKSKHETVAKELRITRKQLALSFNEPLLIGALYKTLTEYLKHPTPDINKSQQITAPIFPFDVSFTIDGIHGFRYGDVLTFDALPTRYRANTVFSIIGINHKVSTDGQWTTEIKCIMRPKID
jgi:hypothetical protein